MSSKSSKRLNILVTGVGAIIGLGIIKSLRMSSFRSSLEICIIGLDRNIDAFGKSLCDEFVLKPVSEDSEILVPFLLEKFAEHSIDIVIPGIEQDVYLFDRYRNGFSACSAKIVLNTPDVIALGRDKWATYLRLIRGSHRAIPTRIAGDWNECVNELGPSPILLKPRNGTGSRGIALLHDEADFLYWQRKLDDNFMVQKLVGSDDAEYTISVFGYGDGTATAPAIFRRQLGLGGATWQAETVSECPPVEAFIEDLNRDFKPLGPTNYQCRVEEGLVYLLEINPRISASTSLRAGLGVNEAEMCIEYFLFGRKNSKARLVEGRAFRYVEDVIEIV